MALYIVYRKYMHYLAKPFRLFWEKIRKKSRVKLYYYKLIIFFFNEFQVFLESILACLDLFIYLFF